MLRIPGPSSRATIRMPLEWAVSTLRIITSPFCAYMTILRASSEIAVAIKVASVAAKPMVAAMVLPCCRARTMSTSERMPTRISCGTDRLLGIAGRTLMQVRESFLQIERGSHPFHGQAKLHHGKCDLRLYANDHGIRAAQAYHIRDVAQCPRGERIHHVQCGDVDDHAMRPETDDFVDQRPAQLQKVRIRKRGLNGGYQKPPLFEDGDFHRPRYDWAVSATGTTL